MWIVTWLDHGHWDDICNIIPPAVVCQFKWNVYVSYLTPFTVAYVCLLLSHILDKFSCIMCINFYEILSFLLKTDSWWYWLVLKLVEMVIVSGKAYIRIFNFYICGIVSQQPVNEYGFPLGSSTAGSQWNIQMLPITPMIRFHTDWNKTISQTWPLKK